MGDSGEWATSAARLPLEAKFRRIPISGESIPEKKDGIPDPGRLGEFRPEVKTDSEEETGR